MAVRLARLRENLAEQSCQAAIFKPPWIIVRYEASGVVDI
jgi:hypothetical protein